MPEEAALVYEMQSRGIDYGQTIARLAVEQFPDGFDDEAGEGMQKIVKTAVTSALDKLAAGGVKYPYAKHTKAASTLVRATFIAYADACRARVERSVAVG